MNAQQLKNSILQMAVQGKLVPQNSHDEPASVLVEKIKAEKDKLIKEKKIKPEKNPSFIFKGADNLPYEKVGDKVRCIADEVPFDIPESWEWVRLGNIITLISGQDLTPDKYNDKNEGIPYITGASNIEKNKITINRWTRTPKSTAYHGDLLLTCKGTFGTMAFLQENEVHIARQIMAISSKFDIDLKYVKIFLESFVSQLKANAKSMIPGISRDDVLSIYFPLPPLAEQERIVAKIEAIMPYVEKYGEKEDKLREINSNISKKLKQSILQEAVQGKLVEQDLNDEPASVLLERIKSEKAQLIKDGKIKKDKNESYIFKRDNSHYEMLNGIERCIDEEIPFDIPDTWEWVRLKNILQVNPRNYLDENLETGFMPMPLLKEGFNNSHTYHIKKWKDIKSGFTHFADNDVVVAKITPCFQNRKSAVIKKLPNGFGAGTTELHVLRNFNNSMFMPYVLLNCKTQNFINDGVKNFSGTAGQQRISKDFIEEYLIPVPPILEQKRIVNKIKELLPFVDKCGKY